MRYEDSVLNIDVHDDGNGGLVDSSGDGNHWNLSAGGNGLRNMVQRMHAIGGRVEHVAIPGEGTRVSFSLKLK